MKILKNDSLVEFDGQLFCNNGKISFLEGTKVNIPSNIEYIVPGFIDIHIHGVKGSDVMDNTFDAIETMKKALVYEGTTSFLPTTLTYDLDVLKSVLDNIDCSKRQKNGANVLGAHVEGPFIDTEYKGAQNEIYVKAPNTKDLNYIDHKKIAKIITYAPEHDNDFEFIKYLSDNNIIGSVGHSGANVTTINEAIKNGLESFTHFHNASSGHHHRVPGVVTSGLMNKNVNVELIVDGIHIHPQVLKMTYDIKGYENITLVTDSMRAKQMPEGIYDLGGQEVIKDENSVRLKNGVLAGSILRMNDAVKNMISFSGCSIEEGFKMASLNQSKLLNLQNKGSIIEGYDFDITLLDKDFNVVSTYVNGNLET